MASRHTSKKSIPSQQTLVFEAPASSGVVVFEDPKRRRLKLLEKEQQRLLRSIRTKRSSLDASERATSDAANELRARIDPFRDAFQTLAAKIHGVFQSLLAPTSRLSDKAKSQVRLVYQQVAEDLLRGAMPDDLSPEMDDFDERWSDDTHHRGGQRGRDEAWGERDAFGGTGPEEREAGYSAVKPAEQGNETLRALFRRLAIALHPDKTQDAAEKATRTETMKEVTRAYETGDVARLVELERAWLASTPLRDDDQQVERRIRELDAANKELRRQLRALTRVAKSTKQVLSEIPSGRGLDEMLEEAEVDLRDLKRLLDFVTQFAAGKMSLAVFLEGPTLERDDEISFDDLPELLTAMAEEFFAEDMRQRRKAPRKKKRPKGKKRKK